MPSDRESWVHRFHPAPASKVRLACLPYAGGSASFYFPISRMLAPAVETLAIQLPGRQDRRAEPAIDSIPVLAGSVADELGHYAERPLALFGHSMGAILAYEVALCLSDADTPPVRLFVSGRRAPSCTRDESVHRRDDAGLIAELRLLGGTDPAILDDPEMLAMALPATRADYRAVETYRHQPGRRLTCPVTVMVGDRDPRTSITEARAWGDHTDAGCQLRVYSGGHFFLSTVLDQVAGLILEYLDAAQTV